MAGSEHRDLAADNLRVAHPDPASSTGNAAALGRGAERRAHVRGGRYFKYRPPSGSSGTVRSDSCGPDSTEERPDLIVFWNLSRGGQGGEGGAVRGRPRLGDHGTSDGASTAQRQRSSTATITLLEGAPASHAAALVPIDPCCLSWFQRSSALGLAAAHVRGAPRDSVLSAISW